MMLEIILVVFIPWKPLGGPGPSAGSFKRSSLMTASNIHRKIHKQYGNTHLAVRNMQTKREKSVVCHLAPFRVLSSLCFQRAAEQLGLLWRRRWKGFSPSSTHRRSDLSGTTNQCHLGYGSNDASFATLSYSRWPS